MTIIKKKVVVIDDELLVREVTATTLAKIGLEVIKAKNGKEGLEKIRSFIPDLIFLDYMMPDLTGLEVASELSKDPAVNKIPIVILSGKAESADIEKFQDLGIEYYLQKPVKPTQIISFIKGEFSEFF